MESRGSCVFHIDLEWKLIYVGSADSESFDQELDTCMVGPVPVGINSFEFEAAAPLPSRIPSSDLIGVTVILLTCSYNDQEFVRVGYYVNTEYEEGELKDAFDKANFVADATAAEVDDDEQDDEDEDNENENEDEEEPAKKEEIERKEEKPIAEISIVKAPDPTKHVDKLVRSVLGEKPRVTRFNIKWWVPLVIVLRLFANHLHFRDVLDVVPSAHQSHSHTDSQLFSPEMESVEASIPTPFNPHLLENPL